MNVILLSASPAGDESKGTSGHLIECEIGQHRRRFVVTAGEGADASDDCALEVFVHHPTLGSFTLLRHSRFETQEDDDSIAGTHTLTAPMPCKIVSVCVPDGQIAKKNELLIVVESMKMEMKLFAEGGGKVKSLVKVGQIVKQGQKIMVLENN